MVKDAVDDTLTVEPGFVMLRQKIGQRLASPALVGCCGAGSTSGNELGASKEGITALEWERRPQDVRRAPE